MPGRKTTTPREIATQEHLKTRDHSTEVCGTSNNFSTGTEIIGYKASYKA
jgi:hypothetical protein